MAFHRVMVGPEPYLATCERCGEQVVKPSMPLSIGAFIAYLKYVKEAHRDCRDQRPPLKVPSG